MTQKSTAVVACLMLVLLPICAKSQLGGVVSATNQFEYSYSLETDREIVENWLDVSYQFGGFRTGLTYDIQQPSEEGDRFNGINQLFFEFATGPFDVRVGTFYGLFGRGLVFASYEDRLVRVNTSLEGVIASTYLGRFNGTVFTGAYEAKDKDVRGADLTYDLGRSWNIGTTVMTYDTVTPPNPDNKLNREWIAAGRLWKYFSWSDLYFEYGWKKGYDLEAENDFDFRNGHALYGNWNLFAGPVGLSLEAKDYEDFSILPRDDGKPPLNNPPTTTREHIYTLLARKTLQVDPNDEVGGQSELTVSGTSWTLVGNASRTEDHEGNILYAEGYSHLALDDIGPFRLVGAYAYQDVAYENEGYNNTLIGDLTIFFSDTHSLELVYEFQHTKLGSSELPDGILDLGAYDTQFFNFQFAIAPKWNFAALLELDNKHPLQRAFGEKEGPFPAFQIAYTIPSGGALTLWAGKRQAGQVCVGGVCKNEPAFEGIEFFGIIRY